MRIRKVAASVGLPSRGVSEDRGAPRLNHWEGKRDVARNTQIKGIQSALDKLPFLLRSVRKR